MSGCSMLIKGVTCLQMQQRENYILSEYSRLTGRHLDPLMKRCSQDR